MIIDKHVTGTVMILNAAFNVSCYLSFGKVAEVVDTVTNHLSEILEEVINKIIK